MPLVEWSLCADRPVLEVMLALAAGGNALPRRLVADTGAGSRRDVFELILDEDDCLQCGGIPIHRVRLSGAYRGLFPVYLLDLGIPALAFDDSVPVVGVSDLPRGFDGIACFKFLRRFSYGNFGNPDRFGLDLLPDA
jgi:hypothetical protein